MHSKTHKYEPVENKKFQEPTVSDNAMTVLKNRYLKKDRETGAIVEDPKEMYFRVASAVAEAETTAENKEKYTMEFYDIMSSNKFMPNSPTLMNAGREYGMLSACFVLPVEDSIDSIFETLKHVALVQKAGGGTGFSFSRLRPDGDIVGGSGGVTSGALSFIDVYSAGTNAIQAGSFRRGANMGVLNASHPDVIEFILAKSDLSRWTNYNVSVAVTDEWMENAIKNPHERAVVTNPRSQKKAFLQKTEPGNRRRSISDYSNYLKWSSGGVLDIPVEQFWTYGEILDLIVSKAWENAEPGMLFIDEANRHNQVDNLGKYEATNPCGEIWLLPYGSCNLGSINLGKYYDKNLVGHQIDYDTLAKDIKTAVRFLDNVVTVNRYPIPQIREMANAERRLGLGVMGFADLLFKIGIRYGSVESIELAEDLSRFIQDTAIQASVSLVCDEGREVYGAWKGSRPEREGAAPRRNSHVTAIAPTGTISIISDCSGGVEPIFSLAFKRQVMKDADGVPVIMQEIHPDFKKALQGARLSQDKINLAVNESMEKGSIAHLDFIPDDIKNIFVTSRDVSPREHVLMQAAWQVGVDNAVSKTINMPSSATKEEVREAYILAWEKKCKGITVYRDGSRAMQPMALKDKKEEVAAPKAVGDVLPAVRIKQSSPFGNMHVNVTYHPETKKELEVFAQVGKAGEVMNGDMEAICRLASLYLRSGGSIDHVIDQLEGIGTSFQVVGPEGKTMSLGDSLAKALKKYKASVSDTTVVEEKSDHVIKMQCPSCSKVSVISTEGCVKCLDCGWAAC